MQKAPGLRGHLSAQGLSLYDYLLTERWLFFYFLEANSIEIHGIISCI